MGRIYGRMARELATPWAFVVEDDVIPPLDAIEGLLRAMDPGTALAVCPYCSRFHEGYVAWDESGVSLKGGEGVAAIGGSGFGATLIRRAVLAGETFASTPGESPDYELAFAARLRAGGWTMKADWLRPAVHLGAMTARAGRM